MSAHQAIVWLIAAALAAIAVAAWTSLLAPSEPAVVPVAPQAGAEPWTDRDHTAQPARFTVHHASAEDLGRLGEAVMAFAAADLVLPTLDIWFQEDQQSCKGGHGLFSTASVPWTIRICPSVIDVVYEHELSHAWIEANVNDMQRSEFLELRGLDHWNSPDVPWIERGNEWAAVVIQQGLSGFPLPPSLSDDVKSRLEAFELLTGRASPHLVDWVEARDVPCPRRPTELSRPVTDVTGRSCEPSRPVDRPIGADYRLSR